MNIRAFQLPQDIDLMNSLVMDGFQYPENPKWNVQEDEKQSMIDRINGAKRLWPIFRVMRVFSPIFRDILCGFIAEVDNTPAGLINYMRQRNEPEWFIANVTVLPVYRRRGIARKLVEATLNELRNRKAKVAFLDVVDGNDPAFNLYQEMGFEAFSMPSQYDYQKDDPIEQHPLPEGYSIKSLGMFDWQTRFNLDQRITPEHVTRYEPVVEGRYRVPFIMPIFGKLFETAGGAHSERFAIHSPKGEVVGIGRYTYRTRSGGVNFANANIDPGHAGLAEFILSYMLSSIQKISPGHRIELNLDDWQTSLIESAEALGCEKRFGFHHMGLRFQN
jgi:ribosomal protein S18 acetylase RimI-like enzyme